MRAFSIKLKYNMKIIQENHFSIKWFQRFMLIMIMKITFLFPYLECHTMKKFKNHFFLKIIITQMFFYSILFLQIITFFSLNNKICVVLHQIQFSQFSQNQIGFLINVSLSLFCSQFICREQQQPTNNKKVYFL